MAAARIFIKLNSQVNGHWGCTLVQSTVEVLDNFLLLTVALLEQTNTCLDCHSWTVTVNGTGGHRLRLGVRFDNTDSLPTA